MVDRGDASARSNVGLERSGKRLGMGVPLKFYGMTKKVAYQGIRGSFSSMAARAMAQEPFEPVETSRFREIFEHVAAGRADLGIVPIENALAGSVHENYDLLGEFQLSIVAEHYLPVELHLVAPVGAELAGVRQVSSHPKALEQCSKFLEERPQIAKLSSSDTAGAAQEVARRNDISIAAIASDEAAREQGLQILARSIQNHGMNATRFVAVRATANTTGAANKCSLLFTLPHQPGSLARILTAIADANGNVTKIESRPITGKPFEYGFYIDVQAANEISAVARAVERLASSSRVLGLYEAAAPLF